MPHPTPSDEELIELWRQGKQPEPGRSPLEELLRRYQDRIARWALLVLGDREEAADCAQEALIRICRGLSSFQGRSRFSTWAYVVTRKVCSTIIARRQRRASRETSLDESGMEQAEPVPEMSAPEREELRHSCRELLLQHTTPREYEILLLHHVEGMTMKAITAKLGLANASGARAYLASARRKLRQRVSDQELERLGFGREHPPGDEGPNV